MDLVDMDKVCGLYQVMYAMAYVYMTEHAQDTDMVMSNLSTVKMRPIVETNHSRTIKSTMLFDSIMFSMFQYALHSNRLVSKIKCLKVQTTLSYMQSHANTVFIHDGTPFLLH